MNLLKEIAPYREQIENSQKGFGFSNEKDLAEVCRIWHSWLIQSDENIYPNNAAQKPVDMSCNACKKKALQLTWSWILELEKREEDKPKKYKAVKEVVQIDLEDQIADEESLDPIKLIPENEKAGWAEHPELSEEAKIACLRDQLDELGVKYHHKQKAKSLQKLLDESK